MKDYIYQRVLQMAHFVIERKCTVRQVAKVFCVSKSTAHKDLSYRLKLIDKVLYQQVSQILESNWEERYIRGGESTKQKYKK